MQGVLHYCMSLTPALQLACLPWHYCILTSVTFRLEGFLTGPPRGEIPFAPTLPDCSCVYFDRKPARSNVPTTSVSYSKLMSCWELPTPSSRKDGGDCLIALAEAILSKWRNRDEDVVTKLIKVFATGLCLLSARVPLVLATWRIYILAICATSLGAQSHVRP